MSLDLYQTILNQGIYIEVKSLREFNRTCKILEKIGIPYAGSKDKLYDWLSSFGKVHYIIFTIPYEQPVYTAGRLEVFHTMDHKGQVEVTYDQLKRLHKSLKTQK